MKAQILTKRTTSAHGETAVAPVHSGAPATRALEKALPLDPEAPSIEEGCGLSVATLLRIANQSGVANPLGCATTLALLSASHAVRANLHRVLKPLGLSETRFHTLVILYSLDPEPSTSADLAYHIETTRTSMTDTLDQMEQKRWIRRKRAPADRRVIHIRLTEEGRTAAAFSISRVLKAAGDMAVEMTSPQHRTFHHVCSRLQQHAHALPA